MPTMNAAVVTNFDAPPGYGPFPEPEPQDGAEVVDVVAAGLHPRVRTGARGAHYTTTGALPMVPGIDGVARRADGTLAYFMADDGDVGTMAERAVLHPGRSIALPEGADPLRIAATVNPAMSSWVALQRRVVLAPGASVLVLGATGNAGRMAVAVARRLGAGRIVGAGRDRARLKASGANARIALTGDHAADARAFAREAAEVDVVLDYLWGEIAASAMAAILGARADRSRPLDWVQIGAITGPEIALPSVLLRSAALRLQGSGQGSVGPVQYREALPSLIAEIEAGTLPIVPRPMALADVTAAWATPDVPGERIVFVP